MVWCRCRCRVPGTVTSVNIDPKVIDPEDPDTLQDLLVGAYNDAHGQLAKIAQDKMGPLQGAMGGFGF